MLNPHGGKLINKIATEEERKDLIEKAEKLKKIVIADRYVSDCEMIANGGFSPLNGFLTKEDAEEVINNIHLKNGLLWSIPIVLPIPEDIFKDVKIADEVALYDKNNRPIAIMLIEDKFKLDIENYCRNIFNTTDIEHPGVKVVKSSGSNFIGGEIIRLLNRPVREGIDEKYYLDPAQVRENIKKRNWKNIVAFQTRNPIHRAHEYIIKVALELMDGVLIHPLVGETKPDDIPANVRMKCYEVLIDNYFNKEKVHLSVLPASMHYAGPREAVHHMLIRKNYGATHMIIGRDHAGVGNYYGTYEAQEFVEQLKDELGIQPLKFEHSFYCTKCENMAFSKTCPHSKEDHLHLSGTKVRAMLREGKRPPKEFSRLEVADVLIKWAINR
ncbi:MAG: sulfate adenylyltransferase [Hydrogenothermaceae bacterium]|nr:sulfate adenylyltransferase [Hydrogenothermaceae bacterium]